MQSAYATPLFHVSVAQSCLSLLQVGAKVDRPAAAVEGGAEEAAPAGGDGWE